MIQLKLVTENQNPISPITKETKRTLQNILIFQRKFLFLFPSLVMSTPLEQQQPPLVGTTQEAYTAHTGHGSVGPVIAVVAVITILGIIAGMIGRLCSGRPIMGHGHYDFEGWVERKCSSCLDGTVVDPPSSRPADEEEEHAAVPADETQQEIKDEEHDEAQKQHGSSSKS